MVKRKQTPYLCRIFFGIYSCYSKEKSIENILIQKYNNVFMINSRLESYKFIEFFCLCNMHSNILFNVGFVQFYSCSYSCFEGLFSKNCSIFCLWYKHRFFHGCNAVVCTQNKITVINCKRIENEMKKKLEYNFFVCIGNNLLNRFMVSSLLLSFVLPKIVIPLFILKKIQITA